MKSQAISIFVTLALLFGGCGIACFASDNETAGTYSAAPEQIVCTPNGDLQTQVGLAWVTDSGTAGTYVRAVEKTGDEEPDFDGAELIEGESGVNGTYRWHKVLVDGLEPGTTYQYQVGDGTTWSAAGEFTTAPADQETFTFLQLNDSQGEDKADFAVWGDTLEHTAEMFPDYALILHGGDYVERGNREYEWEWFFEAAQSVLLQSVFAGATGNHDVIDAEETFSDRFHYEEVTEDSTYNGAYYSFDYGNVHFTVINAQEYDDEAQLDWIKYDIVKNADKWNIVLIHNSLYTNSEHADDTEVREELASVLTGDLGVDAIFAAHDHVYNHTYPIYDGEVVEDSTQLTGQTVEDMTGVSLWDNPEGTVNFLNNACGTKFYEYPRDEDTDEQWFSPIPAADNATGYQPEQPTYAGVAVTEDEIVNSVYYVNDDGEDVLIERTGIRKTRDAVNAPQNVSKTYENSTLTITWEAPEEQEDQSVRQYVVYDENNAFTTENQTYFVSAGTTEVTIRMSEEVYQDTNFVVKAIGIQSISEIGTPADDPSEYPWEATDTSLSVRALRDEDGSFFTELPAEEIPAGSYLTVTNNGQDQVTALCFLALYTEDDTLIGLYPLEGVSIAGGGSGTVRIEETIDVSQADSLQILSYVNSADPISPGALPVVLERAGDTGETEGS